MSVPMLGHLTPTVRASAALAAAGHEVVFWGPAYAHDRIAAAGAEPKLIPGEVPEAVRRRIPADAEGWSMTGLAAAMAEAAVAITGDVVDALHEERPDMVLHDVQAPWARIAAEWLGLPRACSFPLFPMVGSRPRRHRSELSVATAEEEQRFRDGRDALVRAWGIEIGGYGKAVANLADVILSYSTARILGGEPGERWRLVGPLIDGRGAEQGTAPDTVYVALGTTHNRRPETFRAIIDALAGDWPLLVATGGGVDVDALGPLPAGTRAERFVSVGDALAKAVVHVTHGGGSSVHEALAAGVPMVCVPQGSDQHWWADCVADLGVGLVLPDVSAEPLREAVRFAAHDGEMRARARDVADHLRTYDGPRRVVAAVEELLS